VNLHLVDWRGLGRWQVISQQNAFPDCDVLECLIIDEACETRVDGRRQQETRKQEGFVELEVNSLLYVRKMECSGI
jgi:hypothetical protein